MSELGYGCSESRAYQLPVTLEVVQSGLLGLRRSLGNVRLLGSFGFNLDFTSLQQMELGQRLLLKFHSDKNRLIEFCGYIIARQDKGGEHEYSVALEADDEELDEICELVAARMATQKGEV